MLDRKEGGGVGGGGIWRVMVAGGGGWGGMGEVSKGNVRSKLCCFRFCTPVSVHHPHRAVFGGVG